MLPTCAELGIGSSLQPPGQGFLTDTIDTSTRFEDGNDLRVSIPRFSAAARQHTQAMVNLVREVAAGKGVNPGQVALAWLLPSSRGSCPFPAPPGSTGWWRTPPTPTWC